MFSGGRVTSERGQASPVKRDLVVTPLCFLLPYHSQSFVPITENQHRHLPTSQPFSEPSKIAWKAMEKPWLYFKVEVELTAFQLEITDGVHHWDRQQRNVAKTLTFGVNHPWSLFWGRETPFLKYQPMGQDWDRPHPWKYSRTGWKGSWGTWSSGWHSSHGRGIKNRWLLGSLSTQTKYDSMRHHVFS